MNIITSILSFPFRLIFWMFWAADKASSFNKPEVIAEYDKRNNSAAKSIGILLGALFRFIVQWTVFIVVFFVIVYNIWMAAL